MTSSFDPRPIISTGSLQSLPRFPRSEATARSNPAQQDEPVPASAAPLRIGVVGLGVMGCGITASLALAGHHIIGHDLDLDIVRRAEQKIIDGRYGIRRLRTRDEHAHVTADRAIASVTYTTDLDDLRDVDLVVESIPEDLALKMDMFARLDSSVATHAVLASNSSGLPITAMALATKRPEKVVGWHWSSPAALMPFAEIVRSEITSEETIRLVCSLARGARKNPIVVRDHPHQWGFVANRVYFAMIREALRVVEDGVATKDQVDQLMIDCFNWPVGPLGMLDGALRGWEHDTTEKGNIR